MVSVVDCRRNKAAEKLGEKGKKNVTITFDVF
jgi:hypothetical protein